MIDIRVATLDEIQNLNKKMDSVESVNITDFTRITEPKSCSLSSTVIYYVTDGNELRHKYSPSMIINAKADEKSKMIGIRPVIKYSQIKDYCNVVCNVVNSNGNIKYVTFGEYPQNVVGKSLAKTLSNCMAQGKLSYTGKTYFTPNSKLIFVKEAEYLGQKYIYLTPNRYENNNYDNVRLTDGNKIKKGNNSYWIKVSPIKWIVDESQDIAIAEDILMSGIPPENIEYSKSDIKGFLENSFLQEIISTNLHEKIEEKSGTFSPLAKEENKNIKEEKNEGPRAKKKDNVYDFTLERVDEEDIIRGCIKGDIPVFLHGESSEGKSARVKQIDPDCVILYLSNATPESLNGKSVYDANKGEIVDMPPSWYVKLKKKCEEEPDNIHVLFFDELTNALPSIQGMAFNIILDREVNGVWKLPSNCRIAASGNDMDESLAANELAKPLFNRLAHVYIKTTVPNWLKWASKNNIHPAIYAFVAYNGEKVLRTPYNGEKPHADPRRWEMASKMLYATNNPYLLRGIIGEGITEQLVAFCKQTVITLDDVLNHNYTNEDLKMNVSQKYMTAVGLSLVDEKHVKEVREFVTNLGAEICATFDSMWCHGDEERIKKLAEIDMLEGGIRR